MTARSAVQELQRLEESLWRAETRFDPVYMDRILAGDFLEFGQSGRTYSRHEILQIDAPVDIPARLPLPNFAVRDLAADVFLVTYVSEIRWAAVERSNRCSIWQRTEPGWKLRFHQEPRSCGIHERRRSCPSAAIGIGRSSQSNDRTSHRNI